jgi:hypothetical protein
LVHGLERIGDAKHQHHQPLLRELVVVDQVGVDGILEIASLVIGE